MRKSHHRLMKSHFRPFQFVQLPNSLRKNSITPMSIVHYLNWTVQIHAMLHPKSKEKHIRKNETCRRIFIWIWTIFRLATMKVINQLCESYGAPKMISKLFNDVHADDSVYEVIHSIGPHFSETFVYCKLFDTWVDCRKILAPFVSETGLCYSFNTISLREILTDE